MSTAIDKAHGGGGAQRGVGPDGRTLIETLRRNRALLEETGHYHGVSELRLKAENYLHYESLHARLRSAVVNARETSKKISASPGVREVGESVVALYTPEGDSVVLSTGIMVHVHTLSRFIQWMIERDYESDPGIAHGDVFANNDPFVSDVHPPDLMNVTPIFHGQELVGWVGAVAHELEIGGITGGANQSTTAERFGQGMIVSAEKVAVNDTIRRDFFIRAEMNLRTPVYFVLDEKAMVSACFDVREKVLEVIGQYGIDYYKRAIREIIEEGRRAHLQRMTMLTVPGRYRAAAYAGHVFDGKVGASGMSRNCIVHTPLEMTVDRSGFLTIDYEGAGPKMWNPYNCPPAAMDGGFFVTLTQFIDFDGKVNDGCWFATRMVLPPGSWCNPEDDMTSTSSAWGSLMPGFGCLQRMISRAFYARGFREEVFLGQTNTPIIEGGGINQYGQRFGGQNVECSAEGSGARGIMDGIDCGYVGWNPESDMGNVEIWEMMLPILYLGRRIWIDSPGAGKYRGGATFSSLLMIHKTPMYNLLSTIHSDKVFDNQGMCGGYPGPTAKFEYLSRNTDIRERIARREPLPHVEGDPNRPEIATRVNGEFKVVDGVFLERPLRDGDLFQFFYNTGGGYGDPIERDPEAVRRDLDNGIQSLALAAKVYRVEARYDADAKRHVVDEDATRQSRARCREERGRRAVPVREWMAQQRARLLRHELGTEVKEMYNDVFGFSERWTAEYRAFWNLPDGFAFEV
ncbi:MAG: hydantoinase B/oxoprolinase family protein [Candidatus Binatia bacterium]